MKSKCPECHPYKITGKDGTESKKKIWLCNLLGFSPRISDYKCVGLESEKCPKKEVLNG